MVENTLSYTLVTHLLFNQENNIPFLHNLQPLKSLSCFDLWSATYSAFLTLVWKCMSATQPEIIL